MWQLLLLLSFDPYHQLSPLCVIPITYQPSPIRAEHRELLRRLKPEQLSCWAEKWWCIGNWFTYFLSLIINDSMQLVKDRVNSAEGRMAKKGLGFPNLMKLVSTLCLETLLSNLIIPSTHFPVWCHNHKSPPLIQCLSNVCVFWGTLDLICFHNSFTFLIFNRKFINRQDLKLVYLTVS